ncbi:aspartate/glutamate racemase family protein [Mesobacterium sp. TK19101]|uniref:Aspartate/glutamate racemase family protein n=1 Tax=Mesobacterium hydrothermale TaxID=3111907 RepID=A0ABU6HGV5_9RHOB|nr:aspartate/glutamate racemase family protein [Mesobacterium sp. TK19101]MEC3861694.1 aspartate/glutamate racemase family protein [Mesobacterium sp. TK19101]
MKISGGKSFYGASVGILMLESRFPRIPGDMGNAQSWDFPVQYRVVRGASPDLAVRGGAKGLLPAFVEAAQALVADGADGITTTCGFLSLMQADLAAAVGVPVATSSLMQVGLVNALLPPGRRAGVLTVSAKSLTPAHLAAARVPADTPVGSTEGGREFTRAILDNDPVLDVALARQDNIDAALALRAAHPDLGALVLECTNMVPYARDVAQATGLPVFTIHSFISWFQSGLRPRRFPSVED